MLEMEEYDETLPLDIQIEILKRLPIKSLIQLTSVSKTWRSIIRSSRFITDYNSSHIQPHQFFVGYNYAHHVDIYNDVNDISFHQRLILPTAVKHPGLRFNKLIGYSQGLFGFLCFKNNYKDSVIVIWNPSIRKSLFIPAPKSKVVCPDVHFGFMVFNATDPTIFKTSYYISGSQRPQIEIFTLSTGVWRTLDIVPPLQSLLPERKIVIDRFMYWIADDTAPQDFHSNNRLLSFDTTSEQFSELCLPPTLAHTQIYNLSFSKFRESLVVLQISFHTQEIGVWMMMKTVVQNSFTKLYTINSRREFPKVLGFRKNGYPMILNKLPLSCEPDFNDVEISKIAYSCLAGSFMETLLLLDH